MAQVPPQTPYLKISPIDFRVGQWKFASGPDSYFHEMCIQGRVFFILIVSKQLTFHLD